jgi:hypothetical protein
MGSVCLELPERFIRSGFWGPNQLHALIGAHIFKIAQRSLERRVGRFDYQSVCRAMHAFRRYRHREADNKQCASNDRRDKTSGPHQERIYRD